MKPIGVFHGPKKFKNQAASQATYEAVEGEGRVMLDVTLPYKDMLRGLETFSHIWLIFGFHHNADWNAIVDPPRGPKQGVLATRSPYRPNPIGISAVALKEIFKHELIVGSHDLLDGSPIFDIKPYVKESDSLIHANAGWTERLEAFHVDFENLAAQQLAWLRENDRGDLENFLRHKLKFEPLNKQKKRLKEIRFDGATLYYRTWRARFVADLIGKTVKVTRIFSGYTPQEILADEDPLGDKKIHRAFLFKWPPVGLI